MSEDKTMYDHGWPVSEKLVENVKALYTRVMEENKAALIAVDGGVGEGKTTLCTHIGDIAQGSPIDFNKQLAMGGEQFMQKLELCYKEGLHVLVYDEAGDFNKRGALTKLNQTLNRVFETYRAFKILIIVALPNFGVLDNQLFDNKIPRMLVHLRGRTKKQGNFRAYSLYRMLYVRHYMKDQKMVVKEKAYDRVDPNFVGHFLNLPKEREALLASVSTKGKISFLKKTSVELGNYLTYQQLALKVGRSENWTRQAVSKLKIKPARVIDTAKYFSPETVQHLKDEIKRRQA